MQQSSFGIKGVDFQHPVVVTLAKHAPMCYPHTHLYEHPSLIIDVVARHNQTLKARE